MVSPTTVATFVVLALCAGPALCADNEPAPENLNHHKLNVTTFYETEDQESMRFIRDQLYPTYTLIGSEWLDVMFVPYGLAHSDYSTDPCTVRCHNPKHSCDLDKYSACGVSYLERDSDKLVEFVNCVANHAKTTFVPNGVCARELGFPSDDDPYRCAETTPGADALCYMGKLTPTIIKSTPLVYINGKDMKDEQVYKDLLSYVCHKLENQPPACRELTPPKPSSTPTLPAPTTPPPLPPSEQL